MEPRLCPLLDRPCIRGECMFWVSTDTGLRRPAEEMPTLDVGLHVMDCAIPLAAMTLLGQAVQAMPRKTTGLRRLLQWLRGQA